MEARRGTLKMLLMNNSFGVFTKRNSGSGSHPGLTHERTNGQEKKFFETSPIGLK